MYNTDFRGNTHTLRVHWTQNKSTSKSYRDGNDLWMGMTCIPVYHAVFISKISTAHVHGFTSCSSHHAAKQRPNSTHEKPGKTAPADTAKGISKCHTKNASSKSPGSVTHTTSTELYHRSSIDVGQSANEPDKKPSSSFLADVVYHRFRPQISRLTLSLSTLSEFCRKLIQMLSEVYSKSMQAYEYMTTILPRFVVAILFSILFFIVFKVIQLFYPVFFIPFTIIQLFVSIIQSVIFTI